MKATITNCLAELVETRFGKDKWNAIVTDSGLQSQSSKFRLPPSDVPDDQVYKLLDSTCTVLEITSPQAADAFGIGLVKGVGEFYKEKLVVTKLSPQQVKIVFG